ncbi:pesticidal crystal protein cry9Aa (plasmid) [Bacillus thuringiensis]|nr:pesticidal crystal protein cry9Aa [Bacillus thuringiensis]
MNTDQNRNEYELLDTLSNHDFISNRYPFAKNPNAMKNTNYKDWFNECQDIAPSSIVSTIGIMSNIFRQFRSFLEAHSLSIGVGILRGIISAIGGRQVINRTINDVQRLINQALENEIRNQANQRFNSIQSNYNQYLSNKSNYINNPSPLNRSLFVASLILNERDLRIALDVTFSLANRELLLLPSFTQIAMLHLTILRDAVIFSGPDLIAPTISEAPGNSFLNRPPSNSYESALLTSIRMYSNYCVRHYNEGLIRMRNKGNSGRNWLDFNEYRLKMTFTILDFASLFSIFDTTKYPVSRNSTLKVVAQLSRVIYTDPVGAVAVGGHQGWFAPNTVNFTSIENEIPAPTTSRHLSELTISSGPLGFSINPTRTHSWQGNRNVNISAPTDVSGVISNRTQTIPARNIFRVDSRVYTLDWRLYGVYRAEFFQNASQNSQRRVFAENPPTGIGAQSANNFRFLPGENSDTPTPQDYTHLLSRVVNATVGLTPATGNQRNSVLIFGWTHKSLTSENIYRINEITQVAAVNTRSNSGIRVISGPGFTGGDLVRMDPNGSVSYNFTPANQQALQSNVAMRLRYACQGVASLRITFGNGSSQVIPLVSTTSSINNLQYESFRFVNVPNNVSFLAAGTSMTIQNISTNSNVVLDRVELLSNIPIPPETPPIPVVPPLTPGTYQILTALNNNFVIDLNPNNNVTMWTNHGAANQRWNFTYDQSRSAYVIRSVSNPNLALAWDTSSPNRNVFATPLIAGREEHLWTLERFQNGFVIKNLRDANLVLDVAGGQVRDGTNLILFPRHSGNGQIFIIR